MAMEIDEAVIRVDNHAEIDEVEPIEISDDEARRVRLYENFYQVNAIDPALYAQHDVKRGLRNADGTGVLAGMTNISNVHGYVMSDGEKMPAEGSLRLRGYDLYDLLGDLDPTRRFAFEEVAYLLLMGELPTQERLNRFVEVIDSQRELPDGFTASTLMVDTSPDLMNMMARSILRLYAADESAEDRSPEHEIHTALSLISRLPRIMVLAYYAKQAAFNHESMIMHRFVPGQSTAETILSMLRPDRSFTPEEARMLDIMLCLHAEHGGGNNSSFTTHVLSSADTDPYSTYAAAFGSLKGHRHGGANHQVRAMQAEIKENVKNWEDDDEVASYLAKIVNKRATTAQGSLRHGDTRCIRFPTARRHRQALRRAVVAGHGNTRPSQPAEIHRALTPEVFARRAPPGAVRERGHVLGLHLLHDGHSEDLFRAPCSPAPAWRLGSALRKSPPASASSARLQKHHPRHQTLHPDRASVRIAANKAVLSPTGIEI